jgi:hypothetical protein
VFKEVLDKKIKTVDKGAKKLLRTFDSVIRINQDLSDGAYSKAGYGYLEYLDKVELKLNFVQHFKLIEFATYCCLFST